MKIAVLTSGGDCAGLNAAVRSVVLTMHNKGLGEVWGVKTGLYGLIAGTPDMFLPLDVDFWHMENYLLERGGTFLGAAIGPAHEQNDAFWDAQCAPMAANLRRYNFDAMIVVGGDVTLQIALGIAKEGVPVVGVPKTIDNDVCDTQSIGFSTAVQRGVDALDCLKTTAHSHGRTMILEIMGRDAGALPLSVAVAGGADIALIPEIAYNPEQLVDKVRECEKKSRGVLIVTSESAVPEGAESLGKAGAATTIEGTLKDKVSAPIRSTVLGYVQRGGGPNSEDRMIATYLGSFAVHMLQQKLSCHFASWESGGCVARELTSLSTSKLSLTDDLVCLASDIGLFLGKNDISS